MIEQAIIIGLASWRSAALLSYERGPFAVFQRLRESFGYDHDEDGKPVAWPDTELARVFACVWCLSVWVAIAFYLVWQVAPEVVMVVAAAALVPIVERWVGSR